MEDENEKDEPKVQADHNSIAVGKISAGRDISGSIHIGDKVYQYETEEDVPLTSDEIENGLTRFAEYLSERAPILQERFSSIAKKLRATLGADVKSISPTLKTQREDTVNEMKSMSMEVLDISFRALCQGQNPPPYDSRPPFLGLIAFRSEDREFYFGREALIKKLTDRIRAYPFLAVLGSSGSGKSSLVMAGLIPALDTKMAYFTPSSVPLYQLYTAREIADKDTVFVVDQFEELFTLTRDLQEREQFITELINLTKKYPVVITMRADFWGEVATYDALKEMLQEHQELIAPMDTHELQSAIQKQAAAVGLRFDQMLSESILEDVKGEPGAMPLLQHALWMLWKRRHGLYLTAEEYQNFGGVKQAIASTAEDVYASCTDVEQERMRDIFLRLTRLDESNQGRDTRRRALIQDLTPANSDPSATAHLLNKLADARLIVKTDKEAEVAHEALIRHWDRLIHWLNDDRDNLRLREGVSEDAREWEKSNHDESLLNHRGGRLELALAMSQNPRYQLNPTEQAYLSACVEVRERARIEKEQQQRHELESAKKLADSAQAQARAERRGRLAGRWLLVLAAILIVLLSYDPIRRGILRQGAIKTDRISISAGDYQLGDQRAEEAPDAYLVPKTYHISSFSIDIYPVTNERYGFCITAGRCSRPDALPSDYENPKNAGNLVVNITAIDAAEFCDWLDMRLPREKEWELAVQKDAFQAISPEALGGATNFYEFTTSPYDQNGSEWTDISQNPPEVLTLRGGELDISSPFKAYMTKREQVLPTQPLYIIGFRCAVDK